MKILCGKFSDLRRHSLQLFYAIRDHPSTMLYNDEDLEVMFAVADSIGLNCIEVTVVDSRGFDSGTSGCGGDVGANSSGVFDSGGDAGASTSKGISFSGQGLVGHPFESMGDVGKEDDLGAMFCPHQQRPRLSDAWKELIKSVGQLFVGGSEGFRDALRKYSIVHSFEFDFVKNETERVTAVCKVKSCKWNIHARLDKDDVRDKSKKRAVDVVDDLKEYYGVDVSYNRAWLAVQKVKSSAFGDYSDSFNQLQWYRNAVLNSDPRSVFDVEWDQSTNHFLRLFVAFDACVQGFKHCRPVLFVDATFLKARHMGCLMSASAKDGNAAVVHFLSELPNERWANVFFPGQRYGAMSSSLAKCFNSWILKERELPVVDMVDRIRKKMMKSMCLRRERASKWEQVYSKPIYPVASLLKSDMVDCGSSILPPLSKKPPGRPKKKRIRSNGEKVREMKCGRCGKMGNHNKLTCKEDLRPGFRF
ncbi:hypothetical protein RHMOL_Rhmol06G0185700 [Rhododendron molle]|uniref:Uncharacterized protein n=1 Tax=Rhododendron molle TaxID=49168 RepID=A0ACC0NF63_RHOML|nr:hypothetical protein RHMOL_Rhmol06G0185700 [Rhododendron molle]